MNVRKQLAFFCATLLFLQSITLSLPYAYAETEDSVDPQQVEAFRSHQPDYLQLNQPRFPTEQKTEAIRTFSFVNKTFRTTAGQPVLVRFTCALPANEVLIRIPIEGKVVEEQFSNGESIEHSHGEYWILKTSSQQTDFVLPVVFETVGQYFLTIDHDADHFYLEVENDSTASAIQEEAGMSEEEGQIQAKDEGQQHALSETPLANRPTMTAEHNLVISEELIATENARILEEITDSQNRNTSIVTNWSQFRSAWNSSRTTVITLNGNVSFSSSILGDSLSVRSNSVTVGGTTGSLLNFLGSNNSLSMNAGNLTIQSHIGTETSSLATSTAPLVSHSGVGTITLTGGSLQSYRYAPVVSLSGQSVFRMEGDWIVNANDRYNTVPSPIRLADRASFIMTGGRIGSTLERGANSPIESSANTNIYIRGDNIMMAGNLNTIGVLVGTAFRIPWHSTDVHLTGINGSIVSSSISNPNDFEERYLLNHGNRSYRSLIVGATDTSWIDPPMPSYDLIIQASPIEGGSPTSELKTIEQNKNTLIHANPNEGYRFVKWEIISGTNARIANQTAENTTFTMGNSDVSIRAIYEKKTYNLSLSASPKGAGNPQSDKETLEVNATATIRANPNEEYRFVKWEIISGTNARIANQTAENTTFTMGNSDVSIRAIYEKKTYNLSLSASPKGAGNPQSDKETLEVNATATIRANPNEEYRFVKWEIISGTNARIANQTAENTTFTMGNSDVSIRAIYEKELKNVNPLDPLYPDKEINPEKLPILPENQGLFSIDFVSQFDFGSQAISTQDKTYYAKPQQLVSEDGSVIEGESRPNYVQISDRRPENERNGWQLAVTQKEQFKGKENQELKGASLSLSNQQVVTAQGGAAPGLQSVPCVLIPGNRRTLLKAQGNEGTGTWIYRFGDAYTQGESVALNVPKGATPKATSYSTTLIWELSAVPKN
ncbi:WxL domain-containing protein [Enterococcus innesii]|uniref:WxL domain-containing protein n=1 Tax=Enterococcus innesii TaxID=2839759 RepID=UPI0022B969E4|nr:WxL domain-containing protein [Enterococcus innesii]